MNYKHDYHAGNFADVVKHIILIGLMNAMARKSTPYCYIDTHAGSAYYDLFAEYANKTKEYTGGIEKIIKAERPPALVKKYLDCVHQINNHLTNTTFSALKYYPGSPLIAHHFIRPNDRIVACELHPDAYQALHAAFAGDKQIAIHHTDGFLGLKAFLPPHERRGLILIDPPYEDPTEFTRIAHSLKPAMKRFDSGTYAIWYPIKEKARVERFYRVLKENVQKEILAVELTLYPDLPQHLNGCGLAIINPPWQFDHTLQEVLPWLWKSLTINKQGGFHAFLLK